MTNKVRQYFDEKCKVLIWGGQERQCPRSEKGKRDNRRITGHGLEKYCTSKFGIKKLNKYQFTPMFYTILSPRFLQFRVKKGIIFQYMSGTDGNSSSNR